MVQVCDSGQIWKWLNLLNCFPFIRKTLVNHLYIWIWSFWLTFTAWEWMKMIFKISQFEDFCWGPGMRSCSKFEKWLKLLNCLPFIKKTLVNHVYIRIWPLWLTFTVLKWMKTNFRISQFSRFLLRIRVCNSGQNLKMTTTS